MNVPHLLKLLGWNKKPLTFSHFEDACEQQEILVVRPPIKTPGMYFHCESRPVIALSNKLSGVRLWYVAWHELGHHLLHPPGLRCFTRGTVSKIEAEANAIAACAVLDEPTLFRILNEGELHDFPKEMLKFRMKVVEQLRM
jgi:Zn-dependent peptidase ImmA (M78 family)